MKLSIGKVAIYGTPSIEVHGAEDADIDVVAWVSVRLYNIALSHVSTDILGSFTACVLHANHSL